MNNIYNLILFNLLIWSICSCKTKDDVVTKVDVAIVQQPASPAVDFTFYFVFSDCLYKLSGVPKTSNLEKKNPYH